MSAPTSATTAGCLSQHPRDFAWCYSQPLPRTPLVRATLERNQLPDAELIAAGASDRRGDGYLRVDSLAGATSTLDHSAEQTFEEQHWGIPSGKTSIPLVTIDDERSRRLRVDFLKIDVEGNSKQPDHEAPNERSLSTSPTLFVECFHPEHACLEQLKREGYRFVDGDRLRDGRFRNG